MRVAAAVMPASARPPEMKSRLLSPRSIMTVSLEVLAENLSEAPTSLVMRQGGVKARRTANDVLKRLDIRPDGAYFCCMGRRLIFGRYLSITN